MIVDAAVPPLHLSRAGRISRGIFVRATLALGALALAALPALASERLALRGEVTAQEETLSLADLVEGAGGPAAERPLFRAPALGASGTIQARRILDAAAALGFAAVDAGGQAQVVVNRAARRIGLAEVETAVKQALERQHGLEARTTSLVLDGSAQIALVVAPGVRAPALAEDVAYDRRSRRVTATVWVGPNAGERSAELRVAGAVVETVEVSVLTRTLDRGETAQASDFAVERRPRESLPPDAQVDGAALAGRVAKRSLSSGSVVRVNDLVKPTIIARGELVTILYEAPGLTLALRGRASEAGALGDVIAVVNPQSKKVLQATVTGPSKVSVSAALPGRLASN